MQTRRPNGRHDPGPATNGASSAPALRHLDDLTLSDLITLCENAGLIADVVVTDDQLSCTLSRSTVRLTHAEGVSLLRSALRTHYSDPVIRRPPPWLNMG